jgi:hypothetical protein
MGVMCPTIARVAFCTYLLKFTGTNVKLKRFIWLIILTQWLVNIVTMIEILVSCKEFQMLWNTNMKHTCLSPMIQANLGYFQGGMSGRCSEAL